MNKVSDKRRKPFLIIENEVFDRFGRIIGPEGLALYGALARYANSDNQCFPSVQTLGDLVGIGSKTTVRKYLSLLKEEGLIDITPRTTDEGDRTSNLYTLLNVPFQGSANDLRVGQQMVGGGSANDGGGSANDGGGSANDLRVGQQMTYGGSANDQEQDVFGQDQFEEEKEEDLPSDFSSSNQRLTDANLSLPTPEPPPPESEKQPVTSDFSGGGGKYGLTLPETQFRETCVRAWRSIYPTAKMLPRNELDSQNVEYLRAAARRYDHLTEEEVKSRIRQAKETWSENRPLFLYDVLTDRGGDAQGNGHKEGDGLPPAEEEGKDSYEWSVSVLPNAFDYGMPATKDVTISLFRQTKPSQRQELAKRMLAMKDKAPYDFIYSCLREVERKG